MRPEQELTAWMQASSAFRWLYDLALALAFFCSSAIRCCGALKSLRARDLKRKGGPRLTGERLQCPLSQPQAGTIARAVVVLLPPQPLLRARQPLT